jgi:hypothetical protein
MRPLTRSSFLAAAAVLLAGGGTATGTATITDGTEARSVRAEAGKLTAQRLPEFRSALASIFGGPGRASRTGYPRPGWSVKQGQRAARKAANQRRHRRACRKGGRK